MDRLLVFMNESASVWFGIALLFIIFEVLVGSFFLIWLGGAAAIVGTIKYFSPDLLWQPQVLIFSGFSIAIIFLWKKYLCTGKKGKI